MVIRFNRMVITPGFLLLAAAVYFFDTWILFPSLLLAIAVHEAGHLIALRCCGARIEKMYLQCVGFRADYDGTRLSYREEVLTAAAGPLASLLLAAGASVLGRLLSSDAAYFVSGVSLILFFYNMLPIRPLDGGQILHMAAASLAGDVPAERLSVILDRVTAAFMFLAGIVLMLKSGGNFTLLLVTICVVKKNKIV